jgi:hypothetical protein
MLYTASEDCTLQSLLKTPRDSLSLPPPAPYHCLYQLWWRGPCVLTGGMSHALTSDPRRVVQDVWKQKESLSYLNLNTQRGSRH